jgi:hypothetical protein
VAVVLGVASLATRVPGLVSARLFNVDESYLAAMGLTLDRGGLLYVDAVDRKPPVLPWLYSVSGWLVGSIDLRAVRLVAVVVVAATGVVVAVLVRRLGGSRAGAATGGALAVLGTAAFPPADGQAANFELFALLPAAGAVLAVVAARGAPAGRRLVLLVAAGALVALAGMVKQPLLVVALPVAWGAWRVGRAPAVGVAGVGGVAALAALGLPFGLDGVLRWAWADNGDYLDGGVGLLRAAGVAVVVGAAFALLQLPTLAPLWARRDRLGAVDGVVWCWLVAGAVALVPGFRFFFHYFLVLVPPLAALAGLVLSSAPAPARHRAVAAAAAVALVCVGVASLPFADRTRVEDELVAVVEARTDPDDRIVVWGALPELYWRTERLPGARFLSMGYLTGKWPGSGDPVPAPETAAPYEERWPIFHEDLRHHEPRLVVDMTTAGLDEWAEYPAARYQFGPLLQACYDRVAVVDAMHVWELRDPTCLDRLAR